MKDESIVWDHGFKIFTYKTQEDLKKTVEDFSEILIKKGKDLWKLARQNKPEDRFLIEEGPAFYKTEKDFRKEISHCLNEQDITSFSVLDCGVAFPLSIKGNFIEEKTQPHVLDLALVICNILIDPEYKNLYIMWKSVVVGTDKYTSETKVGRAWAILEKNNSRFFWQSDSEKLEQYSKWRTYCYYKQDSKEVCEDTKNTINEILSVRGYARISFEPRSIYINTNKQIIIVSDTDYVSWLCTPLAQFKFKEEEPPFNSWNSRFNTWEKNVQEKSMSTLMKYVGVHIPRTGEFTAKVRDFNWDSQNTMASLACAVLTNKNGSL